jgi:PncC family amidohydrolase
MAIGARNALEADLAVSVTGLAGPGGDDFGNPVGTVFVGYCDKERTVTREFHFSGDREAVRTQTIRAALSLVLEYN